MKIAAQHVPLLPQAAAAKAAEKTALTRPAAPQEAPRGTAAAAAHNPVMPKPLLSPAALSVLTAAQEETAAQPETPAETPAASHGKSADTPAARARAAIAADPSLAGQPFGKIVSMMARGLDLPAPPAPEPELVSEPVTEPVPDADPVPEAEETPPAELPAPVIDASLDGLDDLLEA